MEYGCIGEHLKHSFSKEIHARFADYDYEIREIEPSGLDDFMTRREFRAINVTIPYKRDVVQYLDYIDPAAQKIGAVNTVVNRDGRLFGFNTDFFGMTALINKNGISLAGKKVAVLGTGGTSATAVAVAESLSASEIFKVSRRKGAGNITYDELYRDHSDVEIIINTTPVGMYPNLVGSPVDISRLNKLSGVVDAVYNPLATELVYKAEKRGIPAVCGLYMLVSQAVYAYDKFLNLKLAPAKIDEITDRVYGEILYSKLNIVLIGMPSCGKSTVGKRIAEILKRPFFDSDDEIEKSQGMKISEIFEKFGEAHFRQLEKEEILRLSSLSGAVIATGGGSVLNPESVLRLGLNGRLIFLDRPLEKLITTSSRPLSSDRSSLEKRYSERYGIYKSVCDFHIDAGDSIEDNAKEISGIFEREVK